MASIEIPFTGIKCLKTDKHPQTARSNLGVIEVWQALSGEALWQLALDGDVLHLVTQQLVVNVTGHGGLVHSKSLQGALHPVATTRRMSGRQMVITGT